MRFREHLNAICMNDGDKIEGESEYIAKYMKYMYGYVNNMEGLYDILST